MIGFLASNGWWVIGLAVMVALIVAPAVVLKYRWQVVVAAVGALAAVFALHAGSLQRTIDQQALSALKTAQQHSERLRVAEAAHAIAVSNIEAQAAQEQSNAQEQLSILRDRLRTGDIQLRKRFTCATASGTAELAANAGNAAEEARTGFTAADADTAVRIAAAGDDAIRERNLAVAIAGEYRAACLAAWESQR
jgi:hypothetical protein